MSYFEIWKHNLFDEVLFWRTWCKKQGCQWHDEYLMRMNANSPLQDYIAALLPANQDSYCVLDVGSGPITYLGRTLPGKVLQITCVDALASDYEKMLPNMPVILPVEAEKLCDTFSSDSFDLVYARNCIDHMFDPTMVIQNIVNVVKPNCYVLLEHHIGSGRSGNYHGLHQWDFDIKDNQLIVSDKHGNFTNITQLLPHCDLEHTITNKWLITKIKKLKSCD